MALRQVPEDQLQIVERITIVFRHGIALILDRRGSRGALVAGLEAQEVGFGAVCPRILDGVEVQRDEQIRLLLVGDGGAGVEGQIDILAAGQHDAHRQTLFQA